MTHTQQPSGSNSIQLAQAKLTVSLRITGVRSDGYHLIDAEMVTIDLADELHFAAGDGLHTTLEGAATGGLGVADDDRNLVARALRFVGARAHVTVHKRIPAGAGLGGGSADAAAVLRWAGQTDAAKVRESAALGADVPFCVRGGRARVTGIGEQIEPLGFEARTYTLVLPPFGVSTPAVYRAWDALGTGGGTSHNDLQSAAIAVEPRLVQWHDELAAATGLRPTLAGSGSTWFVTGAHPGPGRVVVQTAPPVG